MKKLILTIITLTMISLSPSFAEESKIQGDAFVTVNGLVCDFCARALEKVFGKQEEVNAIDVNLDTKIITIDFKDGQSLDEETMKALITDAGYNVVEVKYAE